MSPNTMFSTQDYECFAIPYGTLGICSDLALFYQVAILGSLLRSPLLCRKIRHRRFTSFLVALQTLACVLLHIYNLVHCSAVPPGLKLIGSAMVIATAVTGSCILVRLWREERHHNPGSNRTQQPEAISGSTSPRALENGEHSGTEMQNTNQESSANDTAPELVGDPDSPCNSWLAKKQISPCLKWYSIGTVVALLTSPVALTTGNFLFAKDTPTDHSDKISWYAAISFIMMGFITIMGFLHVLETHLYARSKLRHFWAKLFNDPKTASFFWGCVSLGLAFVGFSGMMFASVLLGAANSNKDGIHRSSDRNDVVRYWLYFGFSKLALLAS